MTLDSKINGGFTARVATLSVIDKDGDVLLPGCIDDGSMAVVSPWNHASFTSEDPPIGVARLRSDGQAIYADGAFFSNDDGQQARRMMIEGGPVFEWSIGYLVLDGSSNFADLSPYPGAKRVINRIDIAEVSPVIRGAGIDTGTVIAKRTHADAELLAIRANLIRQIAQSPQHVELRRIRDELMQSTIQRSLDRAAAALR